MKEEEVYPGKREKWKDAENIVEAVGGINAKLMNSDHEFEVNQSVQFCVSLQQPSTGCTYA